MAVLFQVVLIIVGQVDQAFGRAGLLVSGAVLGLTDLDALTLSMARAAAGGVPAETAAQAIAIGIASNTALKATIAAGVGEGRFRVFTVAGLAAIGLAVAATLWWGGQRV
jgi:uncharacterized membrane protein (DUF4010 family)